MGQVSYHGSGVYRCKVGDVTTEHVHVHGVDNEGLWKFIKDCEDANGTMSFKRKVVAKTDKFSSNFEGEEEVVSKKVEEVNKKSEKKPLPIVGGLVGGVSTFLIAKKILKLDNNFSTGLAIVGLLLGAIVQIKIQKK